MIEKIVSGGQTGADRAGLDTAIKLNIPHGGWIPKGRKTENGRLPEKYRLKEMPTNSYLARTKQNVVDSDGTLILSHGALTGGSDQTLAFAEKQGKPCLHADLNIISDLEVSVQITGWIIENKIRVLNVAGPRASQDPMIYKQAVAILETVYYEIDRNPPGVNLESSP